MQQQVHILVPHELPRTGQTTEYVNGDDGTHQAGWPGANRFTDRGDGTVYDHATGLLWVKQPELIIPGPPDVHPTNQIQAARGDWSNDTEYAKADLVRDPIYDSYWVCAVAHTSRSSGPMDEDRADHPDWWRETVWTASAGDLSTPRSMVWYDSGGDYDAIVACNDLQYAGYDDWRLPNMHELQTLLDVTVDSPPFCHAVFPNVQTGGMYWSSTTLAQTESYAVCVDFSNCFLLTCCQSKGTYHYLRPVRGGIRNG